MDIPVNPIKRLQNSDDGAVVNAVDIEGNAALSVALMQGCDIEAIRYLLDEGADVNKANCAGRSPLCIALQHPDCSPDLVRLILKAGASKNACRMHNNLLHCYSVNAKQVMPGVLKLLLVKQIGMESFQSEAMCLALNSVTCRADVVKAMLEMGCHANNCLMHESSFSCYFDDPVLQIKSVHKDLDEEVIKLLLGTVTGEMRNSHILFESPLCVVLRHPSCTTRIIKLFVEARASIRKCYYHETEFHCFIESPYRFRTSNYMGSLNTDVVKVFLDSGAWMEKCSKHGSMLMCYLNIDGIIKADVIKLFLDGGVDAHEVSSNGDTPLHSVLRYAFYEVAAIKMLMDHPGFDVNKTGEHNSSFLHCALQNFNCVRDVVKLLLDKGARTDSVDSSGYTTLQIAVNTYYCDTGIVKMLLDAGCPEY